MTTTDTLKVVEDDLYDRVVTAFARCERATQENIAHEFYLVAARIATEERERCAQVAEDHAPVFQDMAYAPMQELCDTIAKAIRTPNPKPAKAGKVRA